MTDVKAKSKAKSKSKKSLLTGLKNEWALFWASFISDDEMSPAETKEARAKVLAEEFLEGLNVEKLKVLKKSLSDERKKLNKAMESIQKSIDECQSKLEALRLVSGDLEETEIEITKHNDQGQIVSETLARVDQRLKLARSYEKTLKSGLVESTIA